MSYEIIHINHITNIISCLLFHFAWYLFDFFTQRSFSVLFVVKKDGEKFEKSKEWKCKRSFQSTARERRKLITTKRKESFKIFPAPHDAYMLVGLLFLFLLHKSYVPVIRSSHGIARREVTLYYAKDQQLVRSLGEHPFSPLTTFCSEYVLLMFMAVCGLRHAKTVDRFTNFLRDGFELWNVLLHYRVDVVHVGYYKRHWN